MPEQMLTVEGLNELIERFHSADGNIRRVSKSFLREMSIYGVKQAQIHILNVGAVDTNELIDGIGYGILQDGTELVSIITPSQEADKYAAAVDQGSKPHFPPIEALQGWADRHGIPVWAVARKIAKKGTKARRFWKPTFDDLNKHVAGEVSDFGEELLRWL
jgi:hypothetical protein